MNRLLGRQTKGSLALRKAAWLLLAVNAAVVLRAGEIRWDDGDGNSGAYTGSQFTWDNLQAAIVSAEGGGNQGWVRISGDLQRPADDVTTGDLNVSGGNLTISGGWDAGFTTQDGGSTLDVNGADSVNNRFRVLKITAGNVHVANVNITGGWLNSTTDGGDGGGIAIIGANYLPNIRLTRCEISGNQITDYSGQTGAGLHAYYAGTTAAPFVIDQCKITGNRGIYVSAANSDWHVYGGGIYGKYTYMSVLDSTITGNKTSGRGAGVYFETYKSLILVFGCLIAGNSHDDVSYGVQGAGIHIYGYDGSYPAVRFVNCTIADNVDGTSTDSHGIYHNAGYAARTSGFVNSILANNQGMRVTRKTSSTSIGARFQRTTIYEPTGNRVYYQANLDGADTYADSLTAALAWTSPDSLFKSVDDSGTAYATIQNEFTSDPLFLGTGVAPYQLSATSASKDSGLTLTATHADITGGSGGVFRYVPADMNATYNPGNDVIVDLQGGAVTGTAAMHLVYETDLLGNKRVVGDTIDRGACEFSPPQTLGTLIMLK